MAAVPATVTTDEYARKSKTELLAERKKVLGFNVTYGRAMKGLAIGTNPARSRISNPVTHAALARAA